MKPQVNKLIKHKGTQQDWCWHVTGVQHTGNETSCVEKLYAVGCVYSLSGSNKDENVAGRYCMPAYLHGHLFRGGTIFAIRGDLFSPF